MKISSYPKIYTIGHSAIKDIFDTEVVVQEKVDGSALSIMIKDGVLYCRSKRAEINLDYPNNLFKPAIDNIIEIKDGLKEGWIYRGEAICKPKHNTLAYDRVPKRNVILYDIDTNGLSNYLSYEELQEESERLGLECVPQFYKGKVKSFEQFKELLENISILGGQKIEGIVIKNYSRYTPDGKTMMGKYVSERFKEVHNKTWKTKHLGQNDILTKIVESLKTETRWNKAIQHLREKNELTNTPKDIGLLLKEINNDTLEEESEYIKDKLLKWAWKNISRQLTKGFPEYYKEKLAKEAFEK